MTTAVTMYVAPGTTIPSSPQSGKLYEDPANPTPNLTMVSVTGGATTNHGTYSTLTKTANSNLTSTDYTNLYNLLLGTSPVRVDLSYDETASGSNKPITIGPTFTAI
ncbi:MAG TPA: hypothetical protein VIM73_16405 [Polyangiaceae bacterium]